MKKTIKQKKVKQLLALRGKIKIDYDWEMEEALEMKTQKQREKIIKRKK